MIALVSAAFAAPDAASIERHWEAHASALAAHTEVPVELQPSDFPRLAKGRAVARRLDTPGGTFATAAVWVDTPVSAPWVEICDAPHAPPTRLTAVRIPMDQPPGERTVYQRLDLPWPFADRQWVNRLSPNRELYAADPSLWQRVWTVVDPSLAPDPDPEARWVTENVGAWTMLDTGEGTLVVFSLRTVLGGAIPTGVSQSFAVLGLADALERLAALAPEMDAHYDAAHEPVYAPNGRALPRSP